jgi:hypothetical protein
MILMVRSGFFSDGRTMGSYLASITVSATTADENDESA